MLDFRSMWFAIVTRSGNERLVSRLNFSLLRLFEFPSNPWEKALLHSPTQIFVRIVSQCAQLSAQ